MAADVFGRPKSHDLSRVDREKIFSLFNTWINIYVKRGVKVGTPNDIVLRNPF
jgi:hypothetical protein